MPATRSRTENWQRSLEQLAERNGALEITLPRYVQSGQVADNGPDEDGESAPNLIWRVRILNLTETEVIVEKPATLGHTIQFADGIELVGIIAIGQNRWMFKTTNLGAVGFRINERHVIGALRLRVPQEVERCQRRNFYRISTVGVTLPKVECYPLLDPASAAVAETANRIQIMDLFESPVAGTIGVDREPPVFPLVGPPVHTMLMNVGGGGVGLLADDDARVVLESHKAFWLRLMLPPHIPAPLAVSARIKHTHIDSAKRVYAGMAFDFGYDPEHQKFVVDQLCRYVALVQREQLKRQNI